MAAAPVVMAVAAVGSALVGAYSAIQQGQTENDMAKYNAAVAENEARAARDTAAFEADRVRQRREKVLATQRAAFGKSGLQLEGSPLLLMEDTAAEAELDALVIEHQGTVEAARAESQAAMDRMQGKAAKAAGYWGAGASILNGASRVAGMYQGGASGAASSRSSYYNNAAMRTSVGPGGGMGGV